MDIITAIAALGLLGAVLALLGAWFRDPWHGGLGIVR
jgi:hypothetical protein